MANFLIFMQFTEIKNMQLRYINDWRVLDGAYDFYYK